MPERLGVQPDPRSLYIVSSLRRLWRCTDLSTPNLAKLVQSRRHPAASIPDGPAAPWVRRAAYLTFLPVILSKMTGWTTGGSSDSVTRAVVSTSLASGCLSKRTSRTVLTCQRAHSSPKSFRLHLQQGSDPLHESSLA